MFYNLINHTFELCYYVIELNATGAEFVNTFVGLMSLDTFVCFYLSIFTMFFI